MSCDLEVFSIGAPASTAVPQGRGWQITADDPLPVAPGDIPLDVRRALPGVQFVTRLHLEGDASASIEKKLLTVARGLARSARGVIVDPQRGTIETGPGIPAGTPSAVLIGEPYVGLWPDFVPSRSSRAGLRYVDGFVEGTSEARRQIPAPPAGIAQPSPRPATFDLTKPEDMAAMLSEAAPRYPEVWPFDGPLA